MPCGKKFGKVLKNVIKEHPNYSKKKQMKIAWGLVKKK